ncbi:MAG: N-acetylmuramoyl-L-alanine amidase [Pleurocapsa sp. SU_196_0]|nr:N-acetylmuramoyl-L-alanine amidase [Pleurocapsa sp. SU_196_0]
MKIALDPGHGNQNVSDEYDPGAVGGGLEEADIALAWAITGKWVLNQMGIDVWLTRDDDSDPTPLMSRDERAEAQGCTHYISLHCNAAGLTATGTEVFYRDAADKRWAGLVLGAAVGALKLRNRGLKTEDQSPRDRLHVLDFRGSACLLELGFISSPWDRPRLVNRTNRIAFWDRLAAQLQS